MSPSNLLGLLVEHPFADDELLVHTARTSLTRAEVIRAARSLAEALGAVGVQANQGVAVRLDNGPGAITAMMGTWMAGAVLVPLNPRLAPRELDSVLEATRPAALVDAEGVRPLQGGRHFEAGTAFLLWTSGTTGAPKAIVHTHHGYLELLDRVLAPLRRGSAKEAAKDPRPPTPNLIPVSLALNAGIYNALFGLRAGAALVIMERFETKSFQELVRRFAIRSTVLPPPAMVSLNDDADISDLSPLRYVRSITAPLSPLQARRFHQRFGVVVLNSYGQAEIGEVIGWTAGDAREHPDKLGAAGRPLPGVAVKVVGDEGRPLPPGHSGQVLVRPPAMAAGYASGGQLADRVDAEGFVATGDLGWIDPEGFVWIQGRLSDLINRGGNKVVPEEVEEVLRMAPGVHDAAVVGHPDRRLGQVPVAYVVTSGPVVPADLEAHCRRHLTPYKVPTAFMKANRLPRNEAGKVLRRRLEPGSSS